MNVESAQSDLVLLAADKNTESAFRGIFERLQRLGCRAFTYDIFVHPHRDPGCLRKSTELLRPFFTKYRYAIVAFDHEGCGREDCTPSELEQQLEADLAHSGWNDRIAVVVLFPELEVWVWSESPEVDRILGWSGRLPDLRTAVRNDGAFWTDADATSRTGRKPDRPKEAMEFALRESGKPRSAARYLELARVVSLLRCEDRAFLKLKRTMLRWFPAA